MSTKIKPMNVLTCLYIYGCALGLERPRKVNRKNFPSDQSMKIGPLENFPLYGIYYCLLEMLSRDIPENIDES